MSYATRKDLERYGLPSGTPSTRHPALQSPRQWRIDRMGGAGLYAVVAGSQHQRLSPGDVLHGIGAHVFFACPAVHALLFEEVQPGCFHIRTIPALPQNDRQLASAVEAALPLCVAWHHAR